METNERLRELMKESQFAAVEQWPLEARDFELGEQAWTPAMCEYLAAAVNAMPRLLADSDELAALRARIEALSGDMRRGAANCHRSSKASTKAAC